MSISSDLLLFKAVLLLNQNNTQKHILFTFLSLWLTVHPNVHFSTAYSKNVRNVGTETLSPFVDSSVDNVLFQSNPDFTSRFLNSSTFLNVIWYTLDTQLHDKSIVVIDQLLERLNLLRFSVHFNAYFSCSAFPS